MIIERIINVEMRKRKQFPLEWGVVTPTILTERALSGVPTSLR